MPSPEEQKDLDVFLEAMKKIKVDCFDNLRYYQQMTPQDLINSGHRNKTNAEAMAWCYESAQQEIKKLLAEHVKKWPD